MAKSIKIHNTKGIKRLTFTFPEHKGVYLLVGPNGTGKTTLLTCIDRICNPYAFARGFSHPKNITGYDEKMFEGTTAVAFSADEVAPAKVFCKHHL